MIWHPKEFQTVRARYRESLRDAVGILHGAYGYVVAVGTGPGPINVLVQFEKIIHTEPIDADWNRGPNVHVVAFRAVIPRGNLVGT